MSSASRVASSDGGRTTSLAARRKYGHRRYLFISGGSRTAGDAGRRASLAVGVKIGEGVAVEHWNAEYVLRRKGSHIASEPNVRIEVHEVVSAIRPPYHGELLLVILHGTCRVRTAKSWQIVNAGDQVLLVDGEEFEIAPVVDQETATVQFIWMPGLNPCRVCWERDNRFFGKKDD